MYLLDQEELPGAVDETIEGAAYTGTREGRHKVGTRTKMS